MAFLGDMNLRIGVDIKPLEEGMKRGEKIVNSTTKSFQNLGKSSNSAGFALTNLGRVAQDLPFGFIGIQNNLNPLLESFQRLRAESGSSGKALKALAGSLMGAGGLGLALSAASTAILLFQNGFQSFGRKATKGKEDIDKITEGLKNLRQGFEVVGESIGSVEGQISVLNVLSRTILDTNKSYTERNNALNELKKTNESYFGDLTLEADKLATLTSRVNEYTKALVQQAVIKGFESEISKTSQLIFQQQQIVDEAGKEWDKFEQSMKNAQKQAAKPSSNPAALAAITASAAGATEEAKAFNEANETFVEQSKILEDLKGRYAGLNAGINNAVEQSLKFKPLSVDKDGKAVKDVETIAEVLEKLRIQIDFLNRKGLVLKTNESKAQIAAIENAIEHLLQKFGLDPNDPILLNLEAKIGEIQLQEVFKRIAASPNKVEIPAELKLSTTGELNKEIEKELKEKIKPIKIFPTDEIIAAGAALEANQLKLEKTAAFVQDALAPVFDNLFNSIADGSASAFEAFGNALKQLLVQLATTIAKAAALAAIMSIFFPGMGSFSTQFTKILGFAEGGHVKGRGSPTSDSILARLSAGEYVMKASAVKKIGVPNLDRLNQGKAPNFFKGIPKFALGGFVSPSITGSIGGGMAIQVFGHIEARGDKLVTIIDRAQKQIGRNS